LRLSEYKGLSLSLNVPKTELLHEYSSPLGLLSVVKSPAIPFRHAPGLSLKNTQEPPPQLGVFTDGDSLTVITQYDGNRESLAYLDYMTSAVPFHLLKDGNNRVLILGAGGGMDVLQAKYHAIQHIDAVELNPQMLNVVKNTYRDFSGDVYGTEEVNTHIAEARGFVIREQRRQQSYELIQVSLLDSFGASSTGLFALSENYIYTKEAFQDYLSLLRQDGILSITRWLKIPPRDGLKLFATAIEALKSMNVSDPGLQLAMIRSWKTSTLLVKNGIFTEDEIRSIRKFCNERSFDVSYYPGMPSHEANRYNQLTRPYFHEGATALLGEKSDDYIRDYKFDIAPATDDSPYFFHFLKLRSIPEILSLKEKGGLPLLEWGYPILIGTLLQATLASLLLILLPLWWLKRRSLQQSGFGAVFVYFFALGLAFLFIEMAYIQRFILFLSHPLYAIAVVLCAFLIFAGFGSGISSRLAMRCGGSNARGRSRAILLAVCGIVIVSLLYHILLPIIFHRFLAWPDSGRILISLILIAPLAFFMGMPFPLGLALIGEKQPDFIPWAWGINGCASVISAILATLLAIHFGFSTVILLSLGFYLLAAVSLRGRIGES
jgi:spermidine synthase